MARILECRQFIFILWIFTHCKQSVGDCQTPEDCLYKDLFADYNKKIRPALQHNDKVEVTITFSLLSLNSIDEKNEIMHVVGVFISVWSDPRLQWNPSNYSDVTTLSLQSSEIWLPDLALTNSAENFFQKTHKEDFFTLISSDGTVSWAFGGVVSTSCSMDMSSYPLDEQTCIIEYFNWGYTSKYIKFTVGGGLLTDEFLTNSLWNLKNSSTRILESAAPNGQSFVGIQFSITWSRKTLYYQYNLILPIVLLLLVSLGTLWIPPESGERLSLTITVLLAYSVFLIVIMDSTPINSKSMPTISKFVVLAMVVATAMLIESLFIVRLSHWSGRPPTWMRKLAFGYLARVFCSRKEITEMEDNKPSQKQNTLTQTNELISLEASDGKKNSKPHPGELTELVCMVSNILKIMEDKNIEESYSDEWKMIGKLLDKLVFAICFLITIIAIIVVFVD